MFVEDFLVPLHRRQVEDVAAVQRLQVETRTAAVPLPPRSRALPPLSVPGSTTPMALSLCPSPWLWPRALLAQRGGVDPRQVLQDEHHRLRREA